MAFLMIYPFKACLSSKFTAIATFRVLFASIIASLSIMIHLRGYLGPNTDLRKGLSTFIKIKTFLIKCKFHRECFGSKNHFINFYLKFLWFSFMKILWTQMNYVWVYEA